MPFMFYKHAYATISNGGKIIISDEMVMSGKKVNWGFSALDYEYQCEKTHLNIAGGIMRIHGKLDARRGVNMEIKGEASFDDDVLFGPRCRIRIHNKATFGCSVRIAHETQLFDSNFHFMEKVDAPGYYPISRPVIIGSYCWIGNRTTINPGSVLPDYTTVASNSLVNKDFSFLNPNSIIGGIPAKLIREGWTRVWDTKREFTYHTQEFAWYRKRYEILNDK